MFLSETVAMCELPCFDLLHKSGFHLNLHQFKAKACDYLHYPTIWYTYIHVMSLLSSASFWKPSWVWFWELCLSFENCRYRKALKTSLTYVKVLDRPSKENYNDIYFLLLFLKYEHRLYIVKLNFHICMWKYSSMVFSKD